MLEIFRDDGEPPAVRKPVGVQREKHAGGDAEETKTAPCRQQRQEFVKRRCPMRGLRADESVDDAAEQNGLRELGCRERDIGERKHDAEPPLRAEQRENTGIKTKKIHRLAPALTRTLAGLRLAATPPAIASIGLAKGEGW